MKKQLFIGAAALVAMAMTGCQKTGTIEGVVLDPFTGKAVEMPTVWMDSTTIVSPPILIRRTVALICSISSRRCATTSTCIPSD